MWSHEATFLLEHKYFNNASGAQKTAQTAIKALGVLEILAPFRPVLAGTFPLDLQVDGSDLDILTESMDLKSFRQIVQSSFQTQEGFRDKITSIRGVPSFVCGFTFHGFEIEIFCQDQPVTEQDGFLHLLAEYRLLERACSKFRGAILELKKTGIKTEPAFAQVLGLPGNPYESMLGLARAPEENLLDLLRSSNFLAS